MQTLSIDHMCVKESKSAGKKSEGGSEKQKAKYDYVLAQPSVVTNKALPAPWVLPWIPVPEK